MAGIDKIYGTQAQYDEFHAWMRKEKPARESTAGGARGTNDFDDVPFWG